MNERDSMKHLPECDRPYEKIELYGASTLTDSELLAVIIRSGTKKRNALDIARGLLNRFDGSLVRVFSAGLGELEQAEGIGRIKALNLKACGELGNRFSRQRLTEKLAGNDVDLVGKHLVGEMGWLESESFRILMLDKKYRIIGEKEVSKGTLDHTVVHPREVFSPALKELSYALILAHNHPSGSVQPSRDDLELTGRILKAGEILGIPVLDHFVVGKDCFLSMYREGLLEKIKQEHRAA